MFVTRKMKILTVPLPLATPIFWCFHFQHSIVMWKRRRETEENEAILPVNTPQFDKILPQDKTNHEMNIECTF